MAVKFVSQVAVRVFVKGAVGPETSRIQLDQALVEILTMLVVGYALRSFDKRSAVFENGRARREYQFDDAEQYRIVSALFDAMKIAGYGVPFVDAPQSVRATMTEAEADGFVSVWQSESVTSIACWPDLIRFVVLVVCRLAEDIDVVRLDDVLEQRPEFSVTDLVRSAARANHSLSF